MAEDQVKVVLNIKQETFDAYVKENIDDLGLDADEAVQDAIGRDTCKLQGGNLYFVIKKNVEEDGRHLILHLIDNFLASPSKEALEDLQKECKDFEPRHYATDFYKAHQKIMDKIKTAEGGEKTLLIRGLSVIIRGQPDWINSFMMFEIRKMAENWAKLEDKANSWEFIAALARLVKRVSENHEENRCAMMTEGIQGQLCKILHPDHEITDEFENAVLSACAMFQAQLVDDDHRSQGSQAHQRAKTYVVDHNLLENSIRLAEQLLEKSKGSCSNKLLTLISTLLVSNDFCKDAASMNCGELAINLIRAAPEESDRVKACLNLIKALIGNDEVKHKMVTQLKVHEDVIGALMRHFSQPDVALAALRSVTALTLRNPECAKEIIKMNGAEAVVNAINAHTKSKSITRAGLMAVRNCVVRAPELRKPFLELHIESIANAALQIHKLDEAKACLRDLGCEVDLKCIWTGSGKKLEHGTTDRLKGMDIS